jgi:hypothetical protein
MLRLRVFSAFDTLSDSLFLGFGVIQEIESAFTLPGIPVFIFIGLLDVLSKCENARSINASAR